ncbi:MAG: FecR domain-containing protein, partial [Achromobacter sp.]|uniref:FecR family protein n=1 Tax=Achromobacter sp. TaxID=134375 RepID=UPI002585E7C8
LRWHGPASFEQALATAHGQRRTVALPDHTSIDLNTDSRAVVRYYADRREVDLEAGEASFSVSADASRPFVVRAGLAAVRVTGTRFNVRRREDATEVSVSAGSVEVRAAGWAFWRRETLGPGQGLLATRDGLTPAAAVDVAAATAWREGRIVFNNMPLPQAVAELNRYAPFVIRLDGARLARVRVAGTLNVDSPSTLLELLPRIAPVRVQAEGQGRYVLTPTP